MYRRFVDFRLAKRTTLFLFETSHKTVGTTLTLQILTDYFFGLVPTERNIDKTFESSRRFR